jgi:hypothetical protein
LFKQNLWIINLWIINFVFGLEIINVFYPFAKMDMEISKNYDNITLEKMKFIYNAIDDGWSVKKEENKYIFTKKPEGKKEVYLETYLRKFIESNLKLI